MKQSKTLLVSLLSISLISLELVWTRVFSAEFFYTFAFLILSLAVLGLGLGALSLRLFPVLNKPGFLGVFLLLTGIAAIICPPLVFLIDLDFTKILTDFTALGKMALMSIILSSAYFFGGMALAQIFRQGHEKLPKLYMADLVGAALGVLLIMLLMNLIGTPAAAALTAVPVLLGLMLVFRKWLKLIPLVLIAFSVFYSNYSTDFLKKEREERATVSYEHWDAMAKIKVLDFNESYHGLQIDNVANSPLYAFDGNWDRPDSMKYEFGIDVSYLVNKFDKCTFLSLGAGGGTDVLQALQAGAEEVHAVEVVPHINYMMTEGHLAEFTGNIYNDSRVKVITEDARAYVRRFNDKFDVIYSLSSNSWAALASGAFALAENYLFTTEAFSDYWNALSDNGFMMMEHQFYMSRMVSEVIKALECQGVKNVKEHFAVYNLPQMRRKIMFISKRPLTDEIRTYAFGELTQEKFPQIHLLYPAADSLKGNFINRIVEEGWENLADSAKIDISPSTDNRPFIAQLGQMKNFDMGKLDKLMPYEFMGFPWSKLIIIAIIGVILVLIIPLNIIPYFKKGEKLKAAPWLYFFLIGMAFMGIEVVLIQKYSLFIGPSVYAIVTILLTILLASGIGSRYSGRFSNKTVFLGITIWLLLDIFLFKYLFYILGGLPLFPRMLLSSLMIAPGAFLMGMPFPKAGLRVGELIDWGFAVNGAASVLGSCLIVLIAFSWGFSVSLLFAAALYLLAFVLVSMKKGWR